MLFDVQIKRLHEYKRQLMNALGVLVRYRRLKAGGGEGMPPRAVILGGKAAPGYAMAKLILRFICRVADVVNEDPAVAGRLKVVFLPDYNVTLAERLIPAADLSEQISTAGCEASGTGNMKFAMNGALTLGTLDGANIEMREAIGADWFFLFGHTAPEIAALRGQYDPRALLASHPEIAEAVALLADGSLSPEDPGLFRPLHAALVDEGDRYFILADLPAWLDAQDRVDRLYAEPAAWLRWVAHNIAAMGPFSSDRAIREYASGIWGLKSVWEP
jgi:starch phosphorylase